MMGRMTILTKLTDRIGRADGLDRVAKPLMTAVHKLTGPRPVRNLLSGTWLGHPLHPALTDVPVGAWSMAALLDFFDVRAADKLVAAGVVGAVPTAAAGLNDWADSYGESTRIGLVHAAANSAALGLHLASLVARRRGDRQVGKALSLSGWALMAAGGYLGGHLTFVEASNVNHTAWPGGATSWTPVLADKELGQQAARKVDAAGVDVLLYRDGDALYAIAATCTHAGGPLADGTIADGCVTCPWHGSMFRLADGAVVQAPASIPQPRYDTRVNDGQIEVRLSV